MQIKESKSTHKGCVNRFYRLQWLWRFRVPLNIYLSFLYFMINSIPPTIHKHKKKQNKHFWTGDWMKDHYSSTNGICMYKYQKNKSTSWAILAMTKQAFALLLFLSIFFSLVESQTRHFCLLKPSCIESFAFKIHLSAIKQCMFRITKNIICQTEIEGTVRLCTWYTCSLLSLKSLFFIIGRYRLNKCIMLMCID